MTETDHSKGIGVHRTEEFSLAATGDSILTRKILPYEGSSPRFDDMVQTFRDTDIALTNLEVIVHDFEGAPSATSGGTYMRAPPAILDDLDEMGFNLFSAATNHTYDYGQSGVLRTLEEVRARDLTVAGIGETLYEARAPKYVETSAGRVGLVSICTSMPPGSEAGEQTAALRGRPGLNPLHVEKIYQLRQSHLDDLRHISDAAGIEEMKESWLERGLYYNHDWNEDGYFHFTDMKFTPVKEERDQGIVYEVDDTDTASFLRFVSEARANADWVIVTVHTHQGVDGRQNTQETPAFLERVAHQAIDAGAHTVICHGPHVLRGIELYDRQPIFYSLGNYIVQNETVSRLPAESYERYDLQDYTKVSDVFAKRLFDDGDNPKGDLANRHFWETVIPVCTFAADGTIDSIELYPCTLQKNMPRPQRGIPVLASESHGRSILEELRALSEPYNTSVSIQEGVGVIKSEPT